MKSDFRGDTVQRNLLAASLFDLWLKARLLREWEHSKALASDEFSETELLILGLVGERNLDEEVTEKHLCMIFGMTPSAVNQVVDRLVDKGFLSKDTRGSDARTKPLKMTALGVRLFDEVKNTASREFGYLFTPLTDEEREVLDKLLDKMKDAAIKEIKRRPFNRLLLDKKDTTSPDKAG